MQENTLFPIARPLIDWYEANARPLPWRASPTPYHVWLSEVMLQQTRIEAVRPHYARFLAAAPTVAALAALPDDALMKLWEGLGYYTRARNLKAAACRLCAAYGGEMPADFEKIRALPGIGDYTAGAIASISFGLPTPAVDGNVLRLLSRLTADPADVMLPATRRRVTAKLQEVYTQLAAPSGASPACAALTQGLMELGETVCLPHTTPLCDACPLAGLCRARADGNPADYPTRVVKTKKKTVDLAVFVLCNAEGQYAIRRRPQAGLLGGLWELPNLPCAEGDDPEGALFTFAAQHGLSVGETARLPDARHVFTHLLWRMRGMYANVTPLPGAKDSLVWATPEELDGRYALPSAFRAYRAPLSGGR